MTVRFETLWEVSAFAGKIAARLADLKVVGLPAGMLRGTIMSALAALPAAAVSSASHGHGAFCASPGGELSGRVTRFTSESCGPGYGLNSPHP